MHSLSSPLTGRWFRRLASNQGLPIPGRVSYRLDDGGLLGRVERYLLHWPGRSASIVPDYTSRSSWYSYSPVRTRFQWPVRLRMLPTAV